MWVWKGLYGLIVDGIEISKLKIGEVQRCLLWGYVDCVERGW